MRRREREEIRRGSRRTRREGVGEYKVEGEWSKYGTGKKKSTG